MWEEAHVHCFRYQSYFYELLKMGWIHTEHKYKLEFKSLRFCHKNKYLCVSIVPPIEGASLKCGMAHLRVADADKWTCLDNGSTWLVHQVAGAPDGQRSIGLKE